jgi:hypothetical protein
VHPLDGARFKVRRANYHLDRLNDATQSAFEVDPCRLVLDIDDNGRATVRAYDVRPLPFVWSFLIGDCAHNLRAALDYIAYGLAAPAFAPDPVPTTVQFPIFRWRWWYRGERGRRGAASQMKGFPRGARTVVEQLQPYHHRKWDETWLLWQLAEISNVDKHRFLHVTSAATPTSRFRFEIEGAGWVETMQTKFGLEPLKEGAVLVEAELGQSAVGAKVNMQHNLAALEVFGEGSPKAIKGDFVRGTLGAISNFIYNEVIPRFERFFPARPQG